MSDTPPRDTGDVVGHFTARAEVYDRSSHWCTDPKLRDKVLALLDPQPGQAVLDVACGTGLVSRWFKERGCRVVGVDITPAMADQALPWLDDLVFAPAEHLPFPDGTFDVVVCRQGVQFMDDAAAVREMVRVLRPGGRVCVINLAAYGESDRDEYFEILRLRNPARRNFYLLDDLERLVAGAGADPVQVHCHISAEDVDCWSDHGAIGEERREAIREVYRRASPQFLALHAARSEDGVRWLDQMLFGIVIGTKPRA